MVENVNIVKNVLLRCQYAVHRVYCTYFYCLQIVHFRFCPVQKNLLHNNIDMLAIEFSYCAMSRDIGSGDLGI